MEGRAEVYRCVREMVTEAFKGTGHMPWVSLCKETHEVRREAGMCSANCNCLPLVDVPRHRLPLITPQSEKGARSVEARPVDGRLAPSDEFALVHGFDGGLAPAGDPRLHRARERGPHGSRTSWRRLAGQHQPPFGNKNERVSPRWAWCSRRRFVVSARELLRLRASAVVAGKIVLAREGFRVSEALDLKWSDVDLARGMVTLTLNKTDDPRVWTMDPGVVEALRRWKRHYARSTLPNSRVFQTRDEGGPSRFNLAKLLRTHLKMAGLNRSQLFERSEARMPLRVHDLRATFVTIALATGRTQTWVRDRTGHCSSEMLDVYRQQARTHEEASLGPLAPLHQAIPELDAVQPWPA